MKTLYLLLFICLFTQASENVSAQDYNLSRLGTINTSEIKSDSTNITSFLQMFKGQANISSIDTIILQRENLWLSCNGSIAPDSIMPGINYWFRVEMKNDLNKPFSWLLYFNDFDIVNLYRGIEDSFSIETSGERASINNWSYPSDNHGLKINLNPGEAGIYYMKCFNVNKTLSRPFSFTLRTYGNAEQFQLFEIKKRFTDTVFLFFYIGFLSFCFLYFFAQYAFKLKYLELLVYSLYILFTLLYSVRDLDKHYFIKTSFPFIDGFYHWPEAALSYLSYIFYALFLVLLFNLKKNNKSAYILIYTATLILLALLLLDIILKLLSSLTLSYLIFRNARYFLYIFSLLSIYLIISVRTPVSKYFIFGSIALLIGVGLNLAVIKLRSLPSFFLHEAISNKYSFWANTVNYTRFGVLVEIIFFSLGLSKRIQINYAESAILNLNTNYIAIVFHAIKNGLNNLIGLFRSKSANSINYIYAIDDILSDSLEINEVKISLTDELILAKRYFHFRLPTEQEINFEISNPEGINLDKIMVPPMLLQPFIENCLKHAFKIDQQNKKIEVQVIQSKRFVNVIVKDNGVGFSDILVSKKSKGIKLIKDRLKFFNDLFGTNIYLEPKNCLNEQGAMVIIYNLQKINL